MSNHVRELFSLQGKSALVTGASGHLGFALAQALAEAGARVIVSSRDLRRAEETAQRLPHVPDSVHGAVQIDHTDESSLQSGFAEAVRQAGRLDVLVNNGHEPLANDWRDVTAQQFNRQLENLTGYFLLSRLFRDHVVATGQGGSLILIGSMYGLVGSYPDAYEGLGPASPVAYHALKGGLLQMNRHLAVYWARDGVRVNCLSPGPFPSARANQEMVKRLQQKSPLRRMGRPEELKGAIVFLASEASSYMIGQNLVIDGGWTAW